MLGNKMMNVIRKSSYKGQWGNYGNELMANEIHFWEERGFPVFVCFLGPYLLVLRVIPGGLVGPCWI